MNLQQLYNYGVESFKKAEIDDYRFEAECLLERFLEADRVKLALSPYAEVDKSKEREYCNAVSRRVDGEPLQYIIGEWEFMGLSFYVGQGVLIPRPETEMLVEIANFFIKDNNASVIFDLCAGSGAIGLSVAKFNPASKVFLIEKYDEAIEFLNRNVQRLSLNNVTVIQADIFDVNDLNLPKADIILSNPPYIRSDELSSLQSEVLYEPLTALNGGKDGLDFYKVICEKWYDKVEIGGIIALECADGQSKEIKQIFSSRTNDISVLYDFNNIDRVVKINV